MDVRDSVYGFTLPLGATINMDGTAIYVGAATVFIADIAGMPLSWEVLGVVAVGVLASIGAAGVPGAGLIMLSMTISQAGLPFTPVARWSPESTRCWTWPARCATSPATSPVRAW